MKQLKSQSEAVVSAVREAVGGELAPNTDYGKVLNTNQKAVVLDLVEKGILSGEVRYSKGSNDAKGVHKYVRSLVKNHIRKNRHLNGGSKYVPAKPGLRAGQGDEQVQVLRKLLRRETDEAKRSIIKQTLDARIDMVKAAKAKDTQLTAEELAKVPMDLLSKLGLAAEATDKQLDATPPQDITAVPKTARKK